MTATLRTDRRRDEVGAPTWECAAGTVVGWHDADADVVRATGIRYARAGRYHAPVAEPLADEPIDATSWAPACPQAPMPALERLVPNGLDELGFDEDCQRLSITAPPDATPGEALPVMVWIHGGSYVFGGGDSPVYDPAPIVREQRVVVVAVTYRLGMLGYLRGHDGEAANLGLLDQIEALRWVQRNIAAFGGDPDTVTVFGESAGGDAAAHLMIADGAKGLLRRVIVQSSPFGLTRERAEMAAIMRRTAATLIEDDAPVEEVVAAQAKVELAVRRFGLRGAMAFGLQYGADPLPAEDDLDEAWRAAAPDVDVLVGSTEREVALFTERFAVLRTRLLSRVVERRLVAPLTESIYGRGARDFAERHRDAGGRAAHYTMTWAVPGSPLAGAHASDLPLVFGGPAWDGAPVVDGSSWADVVDLGRQVRAIWAEMARTGTVAPVEIPGLITVTPA